MCLSHLSECSTGRRWKVQLGMLQRNVSKNDQTGKTTQFADRPLSCILQVLDRPALAAQLRLLEHDASANNLWDDPAKAQALLKEIDRLKDGVAAADGFTALLEDARAALEMTEQEACTCYVIFCLGSVAKALASMWCGATHDVAVTIDYSSEGLGYARVLPLGITLCVNILRQGVYADKHASDSSAAFAHVVLHVMGCR